jgi:hypothetical protein
LQVVWEKMVWLWQFEGRAGWQPAIQQAGSLRYEE